MFLTYNWSFLSSTINFSENRHRTQEHSKHRLQMYSSHVCLGQTGPRRAGRWAQKSVGTPQNWEMTFQLLPSGRPVMRDRNPAARSLISSKLSLFIYMDTFPLFFFFKISFCIIAWLTVTDSLFVSGFNLISE